MRLHHPCPALSAWRSSRASAARALALPPAAACCAAVSSPWRPQTSCWVLRPGCCLHARWPSAWQRLQPAAASLGSRHDTGQDTPHPASLQPRSHRSPHTHVLSEQGTAWRASSSPEASRRWGGVYAALGMAGAAGLPADPLAAPACCAGRWGGFSNLLGCQLAFSSTCARQGFASGRPLQAQASRQAGRDSHMRARVACPACLQAHCAMPAHGAA